MPLRPELRHLGRKPRILLLGSGGLSIGQAGEFDYSGSQAIKALLEEGMDVILINPNIATVQTNPQPNVKIYLYPVEAEWVERVIDIERPDAVIAGFGGQTALNCVIQLEDLGILKKYNIINLGTPIATLRMTEDREEFAQQMTKIGMPTPPSYAVTSLKAAQEAAENIGYPVIVRAAYALGGLGSGFAANESELNKIVEGALAYAPQVLIEKSVKGWKEVEYEVMRDCEGNTITICNMENFDPLGIHTGDSIVVCPSQSLSDEDYQMLRNASIKIINSVGVVGECNAQFALSPDSHDFYVIEVNARLSRSSALASKASGYPIAYIAAKVVLGYDLLELKNPVTGITYAFFEPALDYITVKFPRWDLGKFPGVSRQLGSTMKSVGEVMSIGRTFPEAIQKAVRMVTEDARGISMISPQLSDDDLRAALQNPTDTRLSAVITALRNGMDIDAIHELTRIDKWFLAQLRRITDCEKQIRETATKNAPQPDSPRGIIQKAFGTIDPDTLRGWKINGFGDEQIAAVALSACLKDEKITSRMVIDASLTLRKIRLDLDLKPVVKKIDTTAGEYPSPSNYLYMSYAGMFSDPIPDDGKVFTGVILGSGTYRIGTSVEFDWCAVSCSQRLQTAGWRSVIINCNPETVSTDYNSSDRLYFEEMTLERILDIVQHENAIGVIASMGGQLPNKLALPLAGAGVKLLGHRPETIDCAEDRSKFSALLDRLGIEQPRWMAASSHADVMKFVDEVGFPVLIRPSYVLSGAAMEVAIDEESLKRCLANAAAVSSDHPVVISEFIDGAREIELDGVARQGQILTAIVSEHIENAGVHSGDATLVVPAQKLYVETTRQVRKAGREIAKGLNLNGPFNIQFLAKANKIKVIECNARAARSFPFVSKTVGLNLADAATDVMIGINPSLARLNEDDLPHVGVKAPMFSFTRLSGVDPILGVEMASTGEVGCLGDTFDEALLLALQASGIRIPKRGILVSSGRAHEKVKFLQSADILKKLGLKVYATEGTAEHLRSHGFEVEDVAWPGQAKEDAITAIREKWVDCVINIPKNLQREELTNDSQIRQAAVRYGCSLFTNMEKAVAFIQAIERNPDFVTTHRPMPLPPYR